jgi:hypothetical protein
MGQSITTEMASTKQKRRILFKACHLVAKKAVDTEDDKAFLLKKIVPGRA